MSPYAEPARGLAAIGELWEREREGADEHSRCGHEIVAVEGERGVVRVEVEYGTGAGYRDLWVVRLGADGRCREFEEWPFWPGQPIAADRAGDALIAESVRVQAGYCDLLGSPLYAGLLRRAAEDFERGGPTRAVLAGHEGDPEGSVLALRMMGAVNRLVLEGRSPELAERYASGDGDAEGAWPVFRELLGEQREAVRELIERPVQTNEVGRCAALLPGFLEVARAHGLPLRTLEVGASAGLNLRWDAYRYEAGVQPGAGRTRRCGSSSSSSGPAPSRRSARRGGGGGAARAATRPRSTRRATRGG